MEIFQVGGSVRDELLGIPSKDYDFVVVVDEDVEDPYRYMLDSLRYQGFKIFLETPRYLTARAQFPSVTGFVGKRLTADFVLARKDGAYTDGRHPDEVIPGTLLDDLGRRDFTINAIAKSADGKLIDPLNGVEDIEGAIIRAVGSPLKRLNEDALRAVRALRFCVTKSPHKYRPFVIDSRLADAMESPGVLDSIRTNISDERIQSELSLMFRLDTLRSLEMLRQFPLLTAAMFAGQVSLDATMKRRGRG